MTFTDIRHSLAPYPNNNKCIPNPYPNYIH